MERRGQMSDVVVTVVMGATMVAIFALYAWLRFGESFRRPPRETAWPTSQRRVIVATVVVLALLVAMVRVWTHQDPPADVKIFDTLWVLAYIGITLEWATGRRRRRPPRPWSD